jgi:transporter family protein
MWIYLGVFSAFFLGIYDISRKHALQRNAVLPVLFFSTVFGAIFVLPAMFFSRIVPEAMAGLGMYVPSVGWLEHLHLFGKAVIVAAAWVLGYFSFKNLPISIVSPIGAAGPVWTLLGAIVFFREDATVLQYIGFGIMVVSYYVFSVIGEREGIVFHSNKWVVFALASSVIGAASGLYDKYMIQTLGYSPFVVQAWFSVYIVPVMGVLVLFLWYPGRKRYTSFEWRWSIPLIGGILIVADFMYFRAIKEPAALIGMLSAVRCSCVVVSFFGGVAMFKEKQLISKAFALVGVVAGVFLIAMMK